MAASFSARVASNHAVLDEAAAICALDVSDSSWCVVVSAPNLSRTSSSALFAFADSALATAALEASSRASRSLLTAAASDLTFSSCAALASFSARTLASCAACFSFTAASAVVRALSASLFALSASRCHSALDVLTLLSSEVSAAILLLRLRLVALCSLADASSDTRDASSLRSSSVAALEAACAASLALLRSCASDASV
mmetsp:Transcript_16380/g.40070  ORF Transcript_16380/g.40070 Transcript_16380/m.40070 type:complete len:200 (+) Transcript_16380:1275-1874(+)